MSEELNDWDSLNIRMEYGDESFKKSIGDYHLEILKKSNGEYDLGILKDAEDSIFLSPERAILKQVKFSELLQLRSAIIELVGRIETDLQQKNDDFIPITNEK